jgi:hypothetical protein
MTSVRLPDVGDIVQNKSWDKKTVNDVVVGDIFAVTERQVSHVLKVSEVINGDRVKYKYEKVKNPRYQLELQIGEDDSLWREITFLDLENGMTITTNFFRSNRVHIV